MNVNRKGIGPEETGADQHFIKTKLNALLAPLYCALALGNSSSFGLAAATGDSADTGPIRISQAIPWSQIGVKAGADYQGDGLAVSPTAEGARLRCVFQRLEGEATRGGLRLTSTVTNGVKERFRIVAAEVGRAVDFGVRRQCVAATPLFEGGQVDKAAVASESGVALRFPPQSKVLPAAGTVSIEGQTVRFTRLGLVEEYSVSMDGVRQDFVVLERPAGAGELAARLAVSGARVEPVAGGSQLVLDNCGRKIAYSRLRVTDATGKELTARMEVLTPNSESRKQKTEMAALVVVVNDAEAVYPVRIDPTFSDANWISMGGIPGLRGSVSSAAVDASGNLYVGGTFALVGNVFATNIAKWDGSSWSALGSGMAGAAPGYFYPSVSALAVSGSDLYAGGNFTNAGGKAANCIVKWNGSGWTALGSGMNSTVYALAVSGSDVYAGGYFTTAGGSAANSIAKWNGSRWTALGSGMNGTVEAIAVSGSDLYAGGGFTTAGGNTATNIAKWDGSSWSALSSGIDSTVYAVAVSGGEVFAGGWFTMAGGRAASNIAKWDGNSWSGLSSGIGGGFGDTPGVYTLAVSGGNVYAGGDFTTAGGSAANHIAKWNGSSWSGLSSGIGGGFGDNPGVHALVVSGSNLYAGGSFPTAGSNAASNIAKWDGNSWSALGSGMNGSVRALTVSGSNLYAGGDFTTVGGSAANHIAKWNGSSWSALGSGLDNSAWALAVSGSDVYAAGFFALAGGSAANGIAKWNGSSWSALGSGLGGTDYPNFPYMYALAVSGSNVYAGGYFTTAGGSAATNIAKWDGTHWTALGSGMNDSVRALTVSGSNLYAGGWFTTAGGSAANYIAKWDGSSWSALGPGMNGPVFALAVSGSDLYAGGGFTTAGGSAATNVAKWDGSSWRALGSRTGGSPYPNVYALAVSGGDPYAGGGDTVLPIGGSLADWVYIAKWDGSNWTALGSGVDGAFVSALEVSGSELYAGGIFTTAGGKVSPYLAKAIVNLPVLAIERDGDGGYFIRFSGVPGSAYRLERAPAVSGPWTASSPQTAPASGRLEFWGLFPPAGQGFYRSVEP